MIALNFPFFTSSSLCLDYASLSILLGLLCSVTETRILYQSTPSRLQHVNTILYILLPILQKQKENLYCPISSKEIVADSKCWLYGVTASSLQCRISSVSTWVAYTMCDLFNWEERFMNVSVQIALYTSSLITLQPNCCCFTVFSLFFLPPLAFDRDCIIFSLNLCVCHYMCIYEPKAQR